MKANPDSPQYRNKYALKVARRLGYLPTYQRGKPSPPVPFNLDQFVVDAERDIARTASRRFRRAIKRGKDVYFVTILQSKWTCDATQLTPALVKSVRDWVCRRARNLSRTGQQRVLGFVDISWNYGTADPTWPHWNVHAHFIVLVKNTRGYDVREVLKRAFQCDGAGSRALRPVDIKRIGAKAKDMRKVTAYCSKGLVLRASRGRWGYIDRNGEPQTKKGKTPTDRQREIDKVIAELGPRPFWILSGLRRRGAVVEAHNSVVAPRSNRRDLIRIG